MNTFQKRNIMLGWLCFCIALITYFFTLAPTASFWDCGEFIATASKLQVGHPPGAPLYMIVTRCLSLFALSPSKVALFINAFSAIISAATIMFLFWTISMLAKRLIDIEKSISLPKQILIFGASMVGALGYAFTDTFWFSAVEAEVYAFSSFFTALVFWAILKWREEKEHPHHLRWILFIAYLMGLSIGVHLLNLLTIPALVFLVAFEKGARSPKEIALTFILSCLLICVVMYGIIPGVPLLITKFERLFVNGLSLPFQSGALAFIVLLLVLFIAGIRFTHKRKLPLANLVLLCITMILIGYSSVATIVIRANANTPINENNPDNAFNLLDYLNREQYGERPLSYGKYYSAPAIGEIEGKTKWRKENDRYLSSIPYPEYEYSGEFKTIFPRMYSNRGQHPTVYNDWGGQNGSLVSYGETSIYKPSFRDNLRFFFNYQLGHMYVRYFLWNFVGRQNDIQSHGGPLYGNWISGIAPIDKLLVGSPIDTQISFPENKARNTYFFLPFLFGLIGCVYQYKQGKNGFHDFWIVSLLFFFTGFAIAIYLNQTPLQPRERDYAYAGSFYAFAIWMGLGVLAITDALFKKHSTLTKSLGVVVVSMLCVPSVLAYQNWDDHDRSGRYMARDIGKNYLETCAPNAILFTYGDNDTFPLWYVQDVENIRPDVRICNLSLLAADWYIDQMKRQVYASSPLPISLEQKDYIPGAHDYVPVLDRIEGEPELYDVIHGFLLSEDERTKVPLRSGGLIGYIPSKDVTLSVNFQNVLKSESVPVEMSSQIVDKIPLRFKGSSIAKNELIILDMIANNKWERPIYFDSSALQSIPVNLKPYLRNDGFAYRLLPVKAENENDYLPIDKDILYANLMEKYTWGNLEDTTVYIDENIRRTIDVLNIKSSFTNLASAYLEDPMKAEKILDRCVATFPSANLPYGAKDLQVAKFYYQIGANEKAENILKKIFDPAKDRLSHYLALTYETFYRFDTQMNKEMNLMLNCVSIAESFQQASLVEKMNLAIDEIQLRIDPLQ